MEQSELSRAISSITGDKVEVQAIPKISKPPQAILSTTSNTIIQRLPGNISVSQTPIIVAAGGSESSSGAASAAAGQIVQSVVMPTTTAPKVVQIQNDRRVVVERIGDTFKVIPGPSSSISQVIIPAKAAIQPKNVKILNTTQVQQVQQNHPQQPRVVFTRAPVFRNIAPRQQQQQQIIVRPQGQQIQVQPKKVIVEVNKPITVVAHTTPVAVAQGNPETKTDKIVIVRKTPTGITELVKLPPASPSAPAPSNTQAKPLSEEEKIDQLMKKILSENNEKRDFHSKELELISNLKRNPSTPSSGTGTSTQPPVPFKKEIIIVPKSTTAAVTAAAASTPSTVISMAPKLVQKTGTKIALSPQQMKPISPHDPKFAALLKTATDKLLANSSAKVSLTDKFKDSMKVVAENVVKKVTNTEMKQNTAGVSLLKTNASNTIEIHITDGQLSDPNGPIKIMSGQEKSPRTQARSQSLVEPQKIDQIKRQIRSHSMPESGTTLPHIEPLQEPVDENLLCDEKIDQNSPEKHSQEKTLTKAPTQRQNKRKTAHKTLHVEESVEKDDSKDDDESFDVDEDDEVDIMSYQNKLSRKRSNLAGAGGAEGENGNNKKKKVIHDGGDESDEGVVADVLQVPISKLFEYGYEPDDIYLSDPFRYIQWKDGIGSLRNGSVHFKINEYGVYEVMSNEEYYQTKKNRGDKHLLMSLNARLERKKIPLNAETYKCSSCGGTGLAEEFIEPTVCSWQCKDSSIEHKQTLKEQELILSPEPSSEEDEEEEEEEDDLQGSWIKETDAPLSLFKNPFPKGKNNFQLGMKLEAIDPFNQDLFCVCTVVDKRGHRLKLRFDGYPADYDFWTYTDAKNIFPPGWCVTTGRTIQPPATWQATGKIFNWNEYLKDPKVMAPVQLFNHLKENSPEKWAIGMKLEADLPMSDGDGVTAATVRDIIGSQILIHLDFYKTNFWVTADSPLIHPIDWHEEQKVTFNSPQKDFSWSKYLKDGNFEAVPHDAFNTRLPLAFRPGMKLEVVDPKNPSLIRPSQVSNIDGYRVRILFDGWPASYAFWINDDSVDLHPVGYAKHTRHNLEPVVDPKKQGEVCSVFRGCLGIGNAKNKTRPFHRVPEECPYYPKNWSQTEISDRLLPATMNAEKVKQPKKQPAKRPVKIQEKPEIDTNPMEPMEPIEEILLPCDGPKVKKVKISPTDIGKQKHELWTINSKKLETPEDAKNVCDWTVEQVQKTVKDIRGCEAFAYIFVQEQINGSAFISLSKDDLRENLGIKCGPSLKIYNRILTLREGLLKKLV